MGNNSNNNNDDGEQHIGNENDHVRQMVARAGRLWFWFWAPFYSQTPKPSAKHRAESSKLLSSALASPSTLLGLLLLLLYGSTKTVLHKILTLRIRRVVFTVTKHFICVQTVRPAYVIPQLALLSCFCVFVFIDFMALLCLCIGVCVCVCYCYCCCYYLKQSKYFQLN